jgi:hypothetical protein
MKRLSEAAGGANVQETGAGVVIIFLPQPDVLTLAPFLPQSGRCPVLPSWRLHRQSIF